jgi:hypothetical protein
MLFLFQSRQGIYTLVVFEMRFRLLHYTSFVPILSCLLVDHWGLKFCWLFYLFFTYLVLERKEWNGYSLGTWLSLHRAAETAMVISLAVSHWVSPWLSPLAWLTLKRSGRPPLLYSVLVFVLYSNDPVQVACILGMVLSEYSKPPSDWQGAVYHRILTTFVQVVSLVFAYRTWTHRLVLLTFMLVLKALVFVVPPDDVSKAGWWNGELPAILQLNIKTHRL